MLKVLLYTSHWTQDPKVNSFSEPKFTKLFPSKVTWKPKSTWKPTILLSDDGPTNWMPLTNPVIGVTGRTVATSETKYPSEVGAMKFNVFPDTDRTWTISPTKA